MAMFSTGGNTQTWTQAQRSWTIPRGLASGPSAVLQLRGNLKCLRPVATESCSRSKGQQQGFLPQ